jgi:hypothetical protein
VKSLYDTSLKDICEMSSTNKSQNRREKNNSANHSLLSIKSYKTLYPQKSTALRNTHMFTLLLALFFNIQAGKSPVSMLSVKYLFSRIEMRVLENV